MGRLLAVNGALVVLGGFILVPLIFSAASRCSSCLLRSIKGFFARGAGHGEALRKPFLGKRTPGPSWNGKSILIVDDDPGVLEFLSAELRRAYPDVRLQTAATYREATMLLTSWTYDLVIFDITGARGIDLLTQTRDRPYPFPAVALNAGALPPAALDRARALGVLLCPSREIVPFLDEVMKGTHETAWTRLLHPVRRRVSFPVGFTQRGYSGVATR